MSRTHLFITLTILLHLTTPSVAGTGTFTGDDDDASVYEKLQTFDFPPGILPKGVIGYDLDESTGKFHAYWNGSCSFSLEGSYKLKYKSAISGYIQKDRLTSLTGVSVKVLFVWLNIIEVTRRDDELEFSVGIASANFPIDNFEECPQCGCGLNCNGVKIRKFGGGDRVGASV